jgi:prefoldin subunit 5
MERDSELAIVKEDIKYLRLIERQIEIIQEQLDIISTAISNYRNFIDYEKMD